MPSYKLMYFNARGRAESVRMLFTLAGQTFEDYRFKEGEWPGELKGNADLFPLGQAPVLIIDGKAMPHSKAMQRHLAREYGFYGANNEEARLIDVAFETCEDILSKLISIYYEKDEAKKKELLETFRTTSKTFLLYLNKFFENATFFVGNKISLADIQVYNTLEYVNGMLGAEYVAQNYPALAKFFKNITENSALANYIKNRPVTTN